MPVLVQHRSLLSRFFTQKKQFALGNEQGHWSEARGPHNDGSKKEWSTDLCGN